MNEKHSYRDYSYKQFVDDKPDEWNDSEIIGTCFAQHEPFTDVFPKELSKVTFSKCNLDNCIVPEGCTVNGGCHRQIKVQNDLEDWIVDNYLNPIEPLNKARFVKLGLSTSPLSLSASKVDAPAMETKKAELEAQLKEDIAALEAAATWR
jgi:hypothetical protein